MFLDLRLPVICLVQILPCGTILFILAEVLRDFVISGETKSLQHGVSQNEEEGGRRYGVAQSLGLFLRIVKRSDILGDALYVQMVVLNLVL